VAKNCVALAILAVAYLAILLGVESGALSVLRCRGDSGKRVANGDNGEEEDEDVAAERRAVESGKRTSDPVVVSHLSKVRKPKDAQ
jgi:hypothetical protein